MRFTKTGLRSELSCVRADGSRTSADLGPGLPYHDLAHLVVERRFKLSGGFFGCVAAGYSLAALGEKAVIQSLGAQAHLAEVLARALGALATGACVPGQFAELIEAELGTAGADRALDLSAGTASELLAEFQALASRYAALRTGEALCVDFG